MPENVNNSSSAPAPLGNTAFQAYSSRTIECPSRKAPIENSIGIFGIEKGSAPGSTTLRPPGEDVGHDSAVADAREVVGLQHPLVVQDDTSARLLEPLGRRHARAERADDPVVEADHRGVVLGDGEVLVVAQVGDLRLALRRGRPGGAADAGYVEADACNVGAALGGLADLESRLVRLVELRRHGVERARAVQAVEVERRRTALHELGRRDLVAERDQGLVEGEVVVDELAEVGETRRDVVVAVGRRASSPAPPCARSASGNFLPFGPTRANRNVGAASQRDTAARGDSGPRAHTGVGVRGLPHHPLALDEEDVPAVPGWSFLHAHHYLPSGLTDSTVLARTGGAHHPICWTFVQKAGAQGSSPVR